MLFNRDIAPRCDYCRHGAALNAEEIACVKRGIVGSGASCAAFSYDPTKRVPERHFLSSQPSLPGGASPEHHAAFRESDFTL